MNRLEKKLNTRIKTELEINDFRLRKGDDFVLRAVNCHDELVEALEHLVAVVDCKEDAKQALEYAREALAKAEGKV